MRISRSAIWPLIRDTFQEFRKDDPIVYASSIAFFTIFSMPSVLIIAVGVAGALVGDKAVQGQLKSEIADLAGMPAATQVEEILKNAATSGSGTLATILGIALLVFSATVVFAQIQKALNHMWNVDPRPERGLKKFVMSRLISFGIVVSLGFLMLVSLVLDTLVHLFRDWLNSSLDDTKELNFYLVEGLNFLISAGLILVVFAMVFKVLPDVKIKWRDVWAGALFTTVLFVIGKYLISLFLSKTSITTTYGAAGSLVALLLWVFYSTIIVLLGSEFTQVYSKMTGRRIQPEEHAVKVKKQEVETATGKVEEK